jgi:hypothetical protein
MCRANFISLSLSRAGETTDKDMSSNKSAMTDIKKVEATVKVQDKNSKNLQRKQEPVMEEVVNSKQVPMAQNMLKVPPIKKK